MLCAAKRPALFAQTCACTSDCIQICIRCVVLLVELGVVGVDDVVVVFVVSVVVVVVIVFVVVAVAAAPIDGALGVVVVVDVADDEGCVLLDIACVLMLLVTLASWLLMVLVLSLLAPMLM